MRGFEFLRCIGRAVLSEGLRGLVGEVPLGNFAWGIATAAWNNWRNCRAKASLREEVEAIAQLAAKDKIAVLAHELASGQPLEIELELVQYLSQVPESTRRSLRRPDDPSGQSLPRSFSIKSPADIVHLLPAKLPRFKRGDRPECLRGEWELEELLGVGGFGEVWRGRHVDLDGTMAAFKFCLDPMAQDRMLRHEATVLNQVMRHGRHPGVVQLLDASLRTDPPWLRYEFVDGGDLSSFFADLMPLTVSERLGRALPILRDLARTVGHFHSLNPPVVHRDLKPANILVERGRDGTIAFRIADFGIGGLAMHLAIELASRSTPGLSMAHSLRGAHSPLYASPQQREGAQPDPRDDVHALGVIAYQLVTGCFNQGAGPDLVDDLKELDLDADLIDLLRRCTSQRVDRRPKNAGEVAVVFGNLASIGQAGSPLLTEIRKLPAPADEFADVRCDEQEYLQALYLNQIDVFLMRAIKRIERWKEAAEHGLAMAQNLYGLCFASGKGTYLDQGESVAWNKKAAEQGYAPAQWNLGVKYQSGLMGLQRDHVQAAHWYRMAADQGFGPAQLHLGGIFALGPDAVRDHRQAATLFRKAAEQGLALAQVQLAAAYEMGHGVIQDHVQAATWYRLAAEQGDVFAMGKTGAIYGIGLGVQQDFVQALGWYRKAAEQGDATAHYNLGVMYERGQGVAENLRKAIACYRKASELNEKNALKALQRLGVA